MTSEQTQQLLEQAQSYQQQVQSIMAQRDALNLQLVEIGKTLRELEETKETNVFKISGPILIKTGKNEVKKELKDREQQTKLRLKTLEKGEERIKAKLEELSAKLSEKPPKAG